jgi:tRNA pseudouridine38-40 synthase
MRYKLTIAYDGAAFHGWQEQTGADQSHLRTVQKVVREAVQHVVRQPIDLVGASRTDTGVHALGQVAQFDADDVSVPLDRMAMAINSRLPDDVEVRDVAVVDDHFDAIKGAVDKQYRYRIWHTPHRPLAIRHAVYHCWVDLNIDAMADAAGRFVGEHDFAAFTNAGHGRTTTVRTVHECRIETHPLSAGHMNILQNVHMSDSGSDGAGRELHIVIRGSGFLYNMVRIIAGTLIEVGRGHWPPGRVDELLASGDRQASGPTLPPNGLVLEWIRYAPAGDTHRCDDVWV